jgi:hypothetical protein
VALQELSGALNIHSVQTLVEEKRQEVERSLTYVAEHFQYGPYWQEIYEEYKSNWERKLKRFEERCLRQISEQMDINNLRDLHIQLMPRFQSISFSFFE